MRLIRAKDYDELSAIAARVIGAQVTPRGPIRS